MVAVALVEVAVERLLLRQALGGVGADGGADVAEDRRGVAAGRGGSGFDLGAGAGGEVGGHPVEEDAVELGSGQFAHLRPHRGEHEADAGELLAQLGQRLAHRRQRLLREAGANAKPELGRVESDPLDVGGDRLRWGAVEGDHGDAEVDRRRGGGEFGKRLQAFGPRVVV